MTGKEITKANTKSGTIVYGSGETKEKRIHDMRKFLKVYNNDFSTQEQRTIGNVWLDLSMANRKGQDLPGGGIASANVVHGKGIKKFVPPTRKEMVKIELAKDARDKEGNIVHELIHAQKMISHTPQRPGKNTERKTDFEAVGRVSPQGLHNFGGYYFTKLSNPILLKANIPKTKRHKIAQQGIYQDRKLLTGSINKNITGKKAVNKANRLFPQSFFNKKKIKWGI